jgi:hypothetical protein
MLSATPSTSRANAVTQIFHLGKRAQQPVLEIGGQRRRIARSLCAPGGWRLFGAGRSTRGGGGLVLSTSGLLRHDFVPSSYCVPHIRAETEKIKQPIMLAIQNWPRAAVFSPCRSLTFWVPARG